MKPLLLMRAKGLSGPMFADHHGVKGLSKATQRHTKAFPELSDSVIFEANIEDGVPGTIVAVYNDDLVITTPFNIAAFTVLVNGQRVAINGVSIDPVFPDNLIIEFHPPVHKGDFVTFQYDARVDPGFIDDIEHKPINYAVNGVTNLVQTELADDDFGMGFGGGYT